MKNNIVQCSPIRISVRLVDGKWEYFYGGELPIKDGTIGELILDKYSIEDKTFLDLLNRKSTHKIFEVGAQLLVALTIKPKYELDKSLTRHLKRAIDYNITFGAQYFDTQRSTDTHFVSIWIDGPTERQRKLDPNEKGGVWLHLEGLEPKGLTTSTVKLPSELFSEPADSLNHAFTLLSELYEPWRKSHTGNIYQRILYQEKNGKWYPLDVLRNAAIAEDEHQLIREQWTEISKRLNIQCG